MSANVESYLNVFNDLIHEPRALRTGKMEGIDGIERLAVILEQLDIQNHHDIVRGAVLTIRRNRLNARLRRINGTERVLDRLPTSPPHPPTAAPRKLTIPVLPTN